MGRRNRITRKLYKGSGYVGKGSYGCVYRPPLQCKDAPVRTTDGISKLMLNSYAEKEYEVTSILEAIDPERKYFLRALNLCDPAVTTPANGVDPSTCTLLETTSVKSHPSKFFVNLRNAKIIDYPDGGVDLITVLNNKLGVNNLSMFLKGFETLLEGLVKLHEAGYAHLDIKAENVVVKLGARPSHGLQPLEMRFIDFSWLSNAETLPTHIAEKRRVTPYPFWPYDMYFTSSAPITEDMFTAYKKQYLANITKHFTFEGSYFSLVPEPFLDSILRVTFSRFQELTEMYRARPLIEVLTKIDIFMLGLLMSTEYSIYTDQCLSGKGGITMYNLGGLQAAGDSEIQWYVKFGREVSIPFFQLITRMLDLDFTRRITAVDALTEYRRILIKIVEYLSEDNVTNHIRRLNPGPYKDADKPPRSGGVQARKTRRRNLRLSR